MIPLEDGDSDAFVELYNNSEEPIEVNSSDMINGRETK
jgi:hypothetical protein